MRAPQRADWGRRGCGFRFFCRRGRVRMHHPHRRNDTSLLPAITWDYSSLASTKCAHIHLLFNGIVLCSATPAPLMTTLSCSEGRCATNTLFRPRQRQEVDEGWVTIAFLRLVSLCKKPVDCLRSANHLFLGWRREDCVVLARSNCELHLDRWEGKREKKTHQRIL